MILIVWEGIDDHELPPQWGRCARWQLVRRRCARPEVRVWALQDQAGQAGVGGAAPPAPYDVELRTQRMQHDNDSVFDGGLCLQSSFELVVAVALAPRGTCSLYECESVPLAGNVRRVNRVADEADPWTMDHSSYEK